MFSWLYKKKPEKIEPELEIEYGNVCEDFIDGEEVIQTTDDVFVQGIRVLSESNK